MKRMPFPAGFGWRVRPQPSARVAQSDQIAQRLLADPAILRLSTHLLVDDIELVTGAPRHVARRAVEKARAS